MGIPIGDTAPDFTVGTTKGKTRFPDRIGDDCDLAPVCTTKSGCTEHLSGEFAKRHVKPLGPHSDGIAEHPTFIDDQNDTPTLSVACPIVADPHAAAARLSDMVHDYQRQTVAVWSAFIRDPKNSICPTRSYRVSVGRNVCGIPRVIDALHTGDASLIATPADWTPGDSGIIPMSISPQEAKTVYLQGKTEARPALRGTTV